MLKKLMEMFKKNNKGFTLVELMVVVVIIGVLTAIAVPVYNNATATAKLNACFANQRIIDSAVMQYEAEHNGTSPEDIEVIKGYFKGGVPDCPSGGVYTIIDDEKSDSKIANCSHEDHGHYFDIDRTEETGTGGED